MESVTPLGFCVRLATAYNTLARRLDGALGTQHGLSFGDLVVLLKLGLAAEGKLRRVDLAAAVGLTPSAVTRILMPLERIGLVARERDVRDARVGYAVLTKTGRRVLSEALASAAETANELIRPQKRAQLPAAFEVLGELIGA